MAFVSYRILQIALDIVELLKRRHLAMNWFGLLNLGFESIRLDDSLRDPDWRFDGRPWRILRKGSLSIPVFRTRSPQEAPREPQIAKIMSLDQRTVISMLRKSQAMV